ncbi:MAG: hypothetical protein NW214_02330 [Pseudanabaenaceae cyanobacterium bins.39]|nr:hypothetical protein [Pseudanabaenaceae cyanobacterium bins.39]
MNKSRKTVLSVNISPVGQLPRILPLSFRCHWRKGLRKLAIAIAILGIQSLMFSCGNSNDQSGNVSTPVADTTKVTPSPAPTNIASPSPTTSAAITELPKLQIEALEPYKHASGVLEMNIPKGWQIEDRSQPNEILITWNESLGRATLSTNIFVPPSPVPEERLSGIFATIIKGMYGDKPGFEMRSPVTEDTGTIVIVWTANIDNGNGGKTQFMGNSRFKVVNNKWVILTFGAIEPQFNSLKDFFFSIAKSQVINGEAAIP